MKYKTKLLFAISLIMIMLLSFSGNALAQENVCTNKACSHENKIREGTSIVYVPTERYCVVYIRTKYKCQSCGFSWSIDSFVETLSHQENAVDRGHLTGNRHRYRYECRNCHHVLSGNYIYTCYGPPCVLPTFMPFLTK